MQDLNEEELQIQAQIMQLIKTGEAENVEIARQIMRGLRRVNEAVKAHFQPLINLLQCGNLWGLLKLYIIDLSYKGLKEIPDCLYNLRIRGSVRLDNNQLTSLPDNFGNLQAGWVF